MRDALVEAGARVGCVRERLLLLQLFAVDQLDADAYRAWRTISADADHGCRAVLLDIAALRIAQRHAGVSIEPHASDGERWMVATSGSPACFPRPRVQVQLLPGSAG
jgi:hypothetical protein